MGCVPYNVEKHSNKALLPNYLLNIFSYLNDIFSYKRAKSYLGNYKYLFISFLILSSGLSLAQDPPKLTPKAALENIFTQEITEAVFTKNFLQAVSLEQIKQIITQITEQLGSYQKVTGKAPEFVVAFDKGNAIARIVLEDGKIEGLLFTELIPKVVDLKDALKDFDMLQDKTSLFVLSFDPQLGDTQTLAEVNADESLAVGSSFKIALLVSLQDKITKGELAWADVIKLKSEWKSLPSGILQDWPNDSQLTLESLATLMISVSDNTAADALMGTLGTENIAESLVTRGIESNKPFISTRTFFTLKAEPNADLLKRYIESDSQQRFDIINESLEREVPELSQLYTDGKPVALEVEWFFSTRELCELMREVQYLPFMGINSGIANKKAWQRVAFKGGSEPGVINLTSWLIAKNGLQYCVSLTQNRPSEEVQEAQVFTFYRGILEALKNEKESD